MSTPLPARCTAFAGTHTVASGPLAVVAVAVRRASDGGSREPILAFDDATGRVIDFDLHGNEADIVARLRATPAADPDDQPSEPRGRGRPKLGVVAREVTLLPRHWDWLAAQPGGASVALRKLVEEARRTGESAQQARAAKDAAYRFMSALAGDLPGFEEAIRALFANDRARCEQHMAAWPDDVRRYAVLLAYGGPA